MTFSKVSAGFLIFRCVFVEQFCNNNKFLRKQGCKEEKNKYLLTDDIDGKCTCYNVQCVLVCTLVRK